MWPEALTGCAVVRALAVGQGGGWCLNRRCVPGACHTPSAGSLSPLQGQAHVLGQLIGSPGTDSDALSWAFRAKAAGPPPPGNTQLSAQAPSSSQQELSLCLTALPPTPCSTAQVPAPPDLCLAWHCQPSSPRSQRRELGVDWDTQARDHAQWVLRRQGSVGLGDRLCCCFLCSGH